MVGRKSVLFFASCSIGYANEVRYSVAGSAGARKSPPAVRSMHVDLRASRSFPEKLIHRPSQINVTRSENFDVSVG